LAECSGIPADDWRIEREPSGSLRAELVEGRALPVTAPAQPFSVSIAHTDGALAVAVARGAEVGVDLERARPGLMVDDVAVAYSPDEIEALAALQPAVQARAVLELWARKEAHAKLLRLGVDADLARLDAAAEQRAGIHVDASVIQLDGRDYQLAVASRAAHVPSPELRLRILSPFGSPPPTPTPSEKA
jgi:phosphopantetheinyl transferase